MDKDRPLVALFAHPDDEFTVFPWIERAQRSGQPVHCIWMTDGGWGGQSVARRREESVRVLQQLGVAREAMHFLGERHDLRDGQLHESMGRAKEALRGALSDLPRDAWWLIPAWEGGHQDHDACHLLALETCDRATPMFQYPLYNGLGLPGPLFRTMSPLGSNGPSHGMPLGLRHRFRYPLYCLGYRSQWKSFAGLLPFYALRMLQRYPFRIQAVDAGATRRRPHAGKLLYERRGGPSWEEFETAVQRGFGRTD